MGLDITAYSNLKPVGNHVDGAHCPDPDHVVAFCYDTFPQSFRGLPILAEDRDGPYGFLNGGCYGITDQTRTRSFQAGSHGNPGGYNRWRVHLARQFNPTMDWAIDLDSGMDYLTEPDPDKPFYELLWFADNAGTIGPDAAADLLADFRQHEAAYVPYYQSIDTYPDWMRACELAAQSGLIHFH